MAGSLPGERGKSYFQPAKVGGERAGRSRYVLNLGVVWGGKSVNQWPLNFNIRPRAARRANVVADLTEFKVRLNIFLCFTPANGDGTLCL